MEAGGLVGESKIAILNKLPEHLIPKTVYTSVGESFESISGKLKQAGIRFPVMAKPNIGSRGFLVKKVLNKRELESFLAGQSVDFLLQEFIDYPVETSILYYRFPDSVHGRISSVTIKKYLSVRGDGNASILQLIKKKDRAKLQLETLLSTHKELMDYVPKKDEVVELVPIGNHCRGATFYNGNHLIDNDLLATFDELSHKIEGIYIGRFDIKCKDIEALKQGRDFKILEVNGVGAEPAHIYDPEYRLTQAFKDILHQWNIIYQISKHNHRNGVHFMSTSQAYHTLLHLLTYKRLARG
jgi:hypothetical protein